MKKQPGVMLYFEIRPCLRRLTCDQQGQLFNAIFNYGEYDIGPDLTALWAWRGTSSSPGWTEARSAISKSAKAAGDHAGQMRQAAAG